MSRDRRRWEAPASSHRGSGYDGHRDEYSHGRYTPSTEAFQSRGFNYWRDEAVAPTSRHAQHSSGREGYEQWRDDGRAWYAEHLYSGRQHNSGCVRDRDDWGQRRDRNSPHFNPSRHRHSAHTPPPYMARSTFHTRSATDSIQVFPKVVSPDPPRQVSPPPTDSCQAPEPSARYLTLSRQPSEVLQDPGTGRKLLVLDLNGTLLIRSPRTRASPRPRLRSVQPRPYMQTFRQYLFCRQTKAWLDTMVWSSAQPHSVDDMVEKVFGTARNELKAVWNRKGLGLSEAEYHRKTATMKDLTKAWNALTSAYNPEGLEGRSTTPPQSIIHSAFTTLLLDDSPHKAVLQPYNHVCIPEYDNTRRRHDLRSLLATKGPRKSKTTRRSSSEAAGHSIDRLAPDPSPRGIPLECAEKEPYDTTLLAVIGILEAVKLQSNVAGWIRRDGLSTALEKQGEDNTLDVKHHRIVDSERSKTASSAVVAAGNYMNNASDFAVTELADLQRKMWFDDSSVVAYWVARGRRALTELGIQIIHGVTG